MFQENSQSHQISSLIDSHEANRYICGCGKVYGSYPAFSTHRKTKHNNQTIKGTKIPKNHDPKRGRPSCQFRKVPKIQHTQKGYYQGLTVIQLGLLNLDQKWQGIVRDHLTDYELKNTEAIMRKAEKCQLSEKILKFLELFTLHMEDNIGNITVNFFTRMFQQYDAVALAAAIQSGQLFNLYFENNDGDDLLDFDTNNKTNTIHRTSLQKQICIILSKWMNKLGLCDYILTPNK